MGVGVEEGREEGGWCLYVKFIKDVLLIVTSLAVQ